MTTTTRASKSTLIRAPLPREIHRRLKYLAADSGMSVQALLVEGALLLLRFHQRADGLPAPMPPCPPDAAGVQHDEPAKNLRKARKGGQS